MYTPRLSTLDFSEKPHSKASQGQNKLNLLKINTKQPASHEVRLKQRIKFAPITREHMSSLPGGPASKISNTYEALWGVRAFLEILQGHASAVCVEEIKTDGAEFYIERKGKREYWQVKRQLLSQENWSIQKLKSERILPFFYERSKHGHTCIFASMTDAPGLRELADRACSAIKSTPSIEAALDSFRSNFISAKKWKEEFDEIRTLLDLKEDIDVFLFLRAVKVRLADDTTLSQSLRNTLTVMFDAPGANTLSSLRAFYEDSVHRTLTAEAIFTHLRTHGISRRIIASDSDIPTKISEITHRYTNVQRDLLIKKQLISRAVSTEIVDAICNNSTSKNIVLTGPAGGGKSGCLLQITQSLQERGIPVLAFRLDRLSPTSSTKGLGMELDLPESPALVLAEAFPNAKSVLIIDQLDFVSATSGRHPDFLETISLLINELRGLRESREIHLILSCREFDYKYDARLQRLLLEENTPYKLDLLSEAEVRNTLQSLDTPHSLSANQIKLLRLPQNLSLYIDSDLVLANRSTFSTQKELYDAYWRTKRTSLENDRPADASNWFPIIEEMVQLMNSFQELSIPAVKLDQFPNRSLNVMVSSGILTFDGRRYGFGHESFFDYCFARLFASRDQNFSGFLKADDQHLFRRAQTRQVLTYLREEDADRYIRETQTFITCNQIRSHLKILVLELIASFPEPTIEEWSIFQPLIDAEIQSKNANSIDASKIASRAFDILFFSQNLFWTADKAGYVEKWLYSSHSWLTNVTATYLAQNATAHLDRTIELLTPLCDQNKEWCTNIFHRFNTREVHKNRKHFDFLKELFSKSNIVDDDIFWRKLHSLSESRPDWCSELIALWLEKKSGNISHDNDLSDQQGSRCVLTCANTSPIQFLLAILPVIINTTLTHQDLDENNSRYDSLWSSRIYDNHLSLKDSFITGCESAFKLLNNQSSHHLRQHIDALKPHQSHTLNSLLLQAYISGDNDYADEALRLICKQTWRLEAGFMDSAHWISRSLIERFSPVCSDDTFATLESVLCNYATEYELSESNPKALGHASYSLTSALPEFRISENTREHLSILSKKFGEIDVTPTGIRSYTVESPITAEVAALFSDEDWLDCIAEYHGRGHYWNPGHPEMGGEQHIAGMMQTFVKGDPERFARLCFRFPENTSPCYWMNILYGLTEATISSELKMAVVSQAIKCNDRECNLAAIDILCSIKDLFLTEDAIEFISSLAKNSDDPERDSWRPNNEGGKNSYGGDMVTFGLNSVRGRVARSLRELFLCNRDYISTFSHTIALLTEDRCLSVRACMISSLFGIAFHQEDLAVRLFVSLIGKHEEILATHDAVDFIRRGLSEHINSMRPLIERMLRSSRQDVLKAGGLLAALARLNHESCEDLAQVALAGPAAARLGATEAASHNFMNSSHREWCESALSGLFDDPDSSVRHEAARCFWHLWQNPEVPLTDYSDLIQSFLASEAFATDPSFLLYALTDSQRFLPGIAIDVCDQFLSKCSASARDIRTSHAGDEYMLGPLIFRIYRQLAGSPEQLKALRLIDRMCEEGLSSVAEQLVEFER